MAKLRGYPLKGNFNTQEGNGPYYVGWIKNTLLKKYSNVPHRSNAMAKYFAIRQGEDESCTQYLIQARDLLERDHSTSKLEHIDAEGFHILLLKGLWGRWVRDRASKQVDKWTTMDEVFSSIMFYIDQSKLNKNICQARVWRQIYSLSKQGSPQARFPPGSPKRTITPMERQVSKTRSS